MSRRWIGAAVVTVLALAACTAGDSGPPDVSEHTSPSATMPPDAPGQSGGTGPSGADGPPSAPADGAAPSTRTGQPGPTARVNGPITLAFAGDVHFEGQLADRLDNPDSALEPVHDELSAADLTVVNFESALGSTGTPEPKRFTFQAPPAALDALAAAGVDVVSMANNHAMDFGPDGFAETLAEREARGARPPSIVGIGADRQAAFRPAVHDVRGVRVAVLGASTPDDPTADPTAAWAATADDPGIAVALDPAPLLDAVHRARSTADVVVVYLHWGRQGETCPDETQRDLAADLADAGADVVVGSHAHRVQGTGMRDGTYVAYGLGNFVWYTHNGPAANTGVLTLHVRADGQVAGQTWAPARIGADGLPRFLDGADAQKRRAEFAGLRDCTDLAPPPE